MGTKALKNIVKAKRQKTRDANETSEELNILENFTVSSSDEDQYEVSLVQTPRCSSYRNVMALSSHEPRLITTLIKTG